MTEFRGLWVPIVTPFRAHRLDLTAVDALIERFAAARCTGLVVCGTTGEASALSAQEKQALLERVLATGAGRMKIVVGIAGTDTASMAEQAAHWSRLPVDGLLVTPPAYVRPSQAGCVQHFLRVAEASHKPVLLYNVAYRTGVNLEAATVAELAADPRIVGIKECGGDLARLHDLVNTGDLAVLCGDDAWTFTALCMGARGAIAAAAHVRPELWVRLCEDIAAQRLTAARRLFAALMPVIRLLFAQPNPAPLKAALAREGLLADELRLPMLPIGDADRRTLHQALETLERFIPD